MTRYLVRFYKNLLSSDGHPFKCLQTQIDVKDAKDATQAARVACHCFEADHRIPDWQLHADTREVVAVEPAAKAASTRSNGHRAVWTFHDIVRALQRQTVRHHGARRR